MAKRKQRDDDDGPAPSAEPASIGQQTSHIANKQKRSAAYAKLKYNKEVRPRLLRPLATEASDQSILTDTVDLQKTKRAERGKRQAAVAKAEELGIQPPAKKIPKVRPYAVCCTAISSIFKSQLDNRSVARFGFIHLHHKTTLVLNAMCLGSGCFGVGASL